MNFSFLTWLDGEQRWFGGVAALGYWEKVRIRAGFSGKTMDK